MLEADEERRLRRQGEGKYRKNKLLGMLQNLLMLIEYALDLVMAKNIGSIFYESKAFRFWVLFVRKYSKLFM